MFIYLKDVQHCETIVYVVSTIEDSMIVTYTVICNFTLRYKPWLTLHFK